MSATDPKEFGKQIALLRKAQGLSQADLAKTSGVPITAIRRCEQLGQIPLDRYLVLASILNASLKVHPAATGMVMEVIKNSRPNTLPYKTIDEVFAAARTKTGNCLPTTFRKPRLGGLFDKKHPA